MAVEELAHRRRAHQTFDDVGGHGAIALMRARDADDQIISCTVVTDPLQDGAAVDVAAFEGREIDLAASADLDRFRHEPGGHQLCEQHCQGPDHDELKLRIKVFKHGVSGLKHAEMIRHWTDQAKSR